MIDPIEKVASDFLTLSPTKVEFFMFISADYIGCFEKGPQMLTLKNSGILRERFHILLQLVFSLIDKGWT